MTQRPAATLTLVNSATVFQAGASRWPSVSVIGKSMAADLATLAVLMLGFAYLLDWRMRAETHRSRNLRAG
jgi:hypothetical protein